MNTQTITEISPDKKKANPPLVQAIIDKDIEKVLELSKNKQLINQKDDNGYTPLHSAILYADVNELDNDGNKYGDTFYSNTKKVQYDETIKEVEQRFPVASSKS